MSQTTSASPAFLPAEGWAGGETVTWSPPVWLPIAAASLFAACVNGRSRPSAPQLAASCRAASTACAVLN
eukprot:4256523-Heterocapsa_arctica.AAC.1